MTHVSHNQKKITVEEDGKKVDHDLDPHCSCLLNGNTVAMNNLKPGDVVELTGDPVTLVTVTR